MYSWVNKLKSEQGDMLRMNGPYASVGFLNSRAKICGEWDVAEEFVILKNVKRWKRRD